MTHSKLGLKPAFYWRMSWRMLWRDWRGGELNILLFAMVIAVTSITAVGFFTDRIERGLSSQSAELIAADLVISSPNPSVRDHIGLARQFDLKVAVTASFRSIVLADGRPQLVEVKSVSDAYPLRGTLRTSEGAFTPDSATSLIPAAGELWVEPRLLDLLATEVGSSISLGNSSFVISRPPLKRQEKG